MSLITVFNTWNPMEAQLIRSRLDAAGLFVTVTHEAAALMTEGSAMATGGIKVQVPEEEADDAREILLAKDPVTP